MKKSIILILFLLLMGCSSTEQSILNFSLGTPQEIICQEDDLPGFYALIDDLSGDRPNEQLTISIDDPSASISYIEETGRLEGWENRFMLLEPTQTLPGFVLCQTVLFSSPDGARAALDWQGDPLIQITEVDRQIGDEMILTQASFDAPDGSRWIDHRVEFSYRNLIGAISTYTPEGIANPDFALDIAEILYQRMQNQAP